MVERGKGKSRSEGDSEQKQQEAKDGNPGGVGGGQ
jgi:hypothetical protein